MKKDQFYIIFIIPFLIIVFSCTNNSEIIVPHYDFVNPAYLSLEYEHVADSIYFYSWHWNDIPFEEIMTDSLLITANGNKVVKVNVNRPQRVNFYFNEKRFDFFVVPGDTTIVNFDFSGNLDSIIPEFKGKLASVNYYYFEKFKRFNTWDFFIPRAGFTQSSLDANDLAKNNDDLTKLELDFLYEYCKNHPLQPPWFQDFEKQNILITSGYFKNNSLFYRHHMLGMNDTLPEDYFDFFDSIYVNSETSILSDYYFSYLSNLISVQFRSYYSEGFDTLQNLMKNEDYYIFLIKYISELDQPARELFSLYTLFDYSKITPQYLWKIDTLKDNIISDQYLQLLENTDFSAYQLPEKTKAPDFYLSDIDGKFWTLNRFKDKVVLLNFWSTNCQPCLKEFPYEDTLVEVYKDSDFQLINICLTSSFDKWERRIRGHNGVLQLFARDQWNEILKEKYKVYGVPKLILIDKNGFVANSNAPRSSNPKLKTEIDKLLSADK